MTNFSINGFHIGCESQFPEGMMRELLPLFMEKPSKNATGVLSGRGFVVRRETEGLGRIVVKHYSRGGWLRHVVESLYLRCGKSRSEIEFEMLTRARAVGVSVPEPLVWADQGKFFYRAWLVTREIENKESLAELSLRNEDEAIAVLEKFTRQLNLLIEAGIFHVDLHPGNVILDPQGKVFILDFDKAEIFQGSADALRERYVRRWRRAVLKHELPESIAEHMSFQIKIGASCRTKAA